MHGVWLGWLGSVGWAGGWKGGFVDVIKYRVWERKPTSFDHIGIIILPGKSASTLKIMYVLYRCMYVCIADMHLPGLPCCCSVPVLLLPCLLGIC